MLMTQYNQPYPDSIYAKTRNDLTIKKFGAEELIVENCVIGGGLAGINSALALLNNDRRPVALLEANQIGWGASGRNGGFVSSGYALGIKDIIKKTNLEHAKLLHGLTTSALGLIKQRIKDHNIDCGPVVQGNLTASLWDNSKKIQDNIDFLNKNFDENLIYWDKEKVRKHYKTTAYHCGVFDDSAFHLHPLNLTLGLAGAVIDKGGYIFDNSPALDIKKQHGKIIIKCNGGRIIADNVIIACSGYIENLYPKICRATLPITTYVMVTEPLGKGGLSEITDKNYSVIDQRISCDYYRPLPDGSTRIIWGGRITAFPAKPENIANIMRQNMLRIYPQLSHIKIDYSWSGIMGYAAHKMPLICQLDENIWVNTCFGGHGLATTTVGGEVIAKAICGNDKDLQLFKPFKLNFAGGKLGPIAAQAYYFANYLKDELNIWRSN